VATAAPARREDWPLVVAATELLEQEGLKGATIYRGELVAPAVWWITYERGGAAWTAILDGAEPRDWELLRTMEGWPVP
jgi:hypothetical protein